MTEKEIPRPRAWHKERKEYYVVLKIDYLNGEVIIIPVGVVSFDLNEVVPIDEVILEWPIGLPDKTGKMIYQGDVVKVHQFLFDGSEIEEDHVGVITYCSECAAFKLDKIKGDFWEKYTGYKSFEEGAPICHFYGLHEESFEVIGNVNENPELKESE
jgi:uncharacterized phage protein (TIGR01671 family)